MVASGNIDSHPVVAGVFLVPSLLPLLVSQTVLHARSEIHIRRHMPRYLSLSLPHLLPASLSFPLVLRQLPPLFVVGLLQFLPILLPFFPLLCALLHCLLRLGHIEGVNRKTSKKKEIE